MLSKCFQSTLRSRSIMNHFLSQQQQFYFADINLRNIGISAHIDSGKTTFTERVLYYAGKIDSIHEVKGSDNVGATMDFMELEREKGITIQSAATYVSWKDTPVNVIDTPGHVDFTVEVERALKVLDGGILLVCGVSGVQPQTLTVFKQMKRYNVPRLIFINKLDRMGANPWNAIDSIRSRLDCKCAAVQIPIGLDQDLKGVIDIIEQKAYLFEGAAGDQLREIDIPEHYKEQVAARRQELIEQIADVDPEIEELYLCEEEISVEQLKKSIRAQTIAQTFSPVFMGSAIKNKGIQLALDGVIEYLPKPNELQNNGFLEKQEEGEKVEEEIVFDIEDQKKPFVGYAFKLEENKFGQLTYCRVYQTQKGDYVWNTTAQKRMKISRMIKMHANEMVDINVANPGDIFAIFGVECSSGDTLTEGDMSYPARCSSMFVPDPVISFSIKPKKGQNTSKFNKALNKFQREDPTFRVNIDKESEEIIISGMGELHLQIYAERIKREFGIDCEVGNPTVNFRETIGQKANFDYLHKKQSGGAGQYARVTGYIEPLPSDDPTDFGCLFENKVVSASIPNEFIGAVEKGFYEAVEKGPITGYPVVNVKFVLTDGVTHPVDSSSTAFMIATKYAFRQAFQKAQEQLLEPIMNLEVACPQNDYSNVMAAISKRRGLVTNTETRGDLFVLNADVPLSQMFGFATELRGLTSGLGEFSMEYKNHEALPPNEVETIKAEFIKKNGGEVKVI